MADWNCPCVNKALSCISSVCAGCLNMCATNCKALLFTRTSESYAHMFHALCARTPLKISGFQLVARTSHRMLRPLHRSTGKWLTSVTRCHPTCHHVTPNVPNMWPEHRGQAPPQTLRCLLVCPMSHGVMTSTSHPRTHPHTRT